MKWLWNGGTGCGSPGNEEGTAQRTYANQILIGKRICGEGGYREESRAPEGSGGDCGGSRDSGAGTIRPQEREREPKGRITPLAPRHR
jgi:hypothetical protein